MWINSKQAVFNVLQIITLYRSFPSRVLSCKLCQVQYFLAIKYYQSFACFGVINPIIMALTFVFFGKKLHLLIKNKFNLQQYQLSFIYNVFISIFMQIKHYTEKKAQSKFSSAYRMPDNIEYDLLTHKVMALQAKLAQCQSVIDTLKFHNDDLDQQVQTKNEEILKLREESQRLKILASSVEKQLEARKKSSEDIIMQLRLENSESKQKNIRLCEVIKLLQSKLAAQKIKQSQKLLLEENLRKKISTMADQNDLMKKTMAKLEVQSEKYKLKALEGQKYWSNKLEKFKQKENQAFSQKKTYLEQRHQDQIVNLRSEVIKLQKMIKIKEENIKKLQSKIQMFILQTN